MLEIDEFYGGEIMTVKIARERGLRYARFVLTGEETGAGGVEGMVGGYAFVNNECVVTGELNQHQPGNAIISLGHHNVPCVEVG